QHRPRDGERNGAGHRRDHRGHPGGEQRLGLEQRRHRGHSDLRAHRNLPVFISATDLHLTGTSPVLNAGLAGVTAVDGTGATVNGVPDREYAAALGTIARAAGSALDLGAYGFPRTGDAGTPDAGAPDAGPPPDAGASA